MSARRGSAHPVPLLPGTQQRAARRQVGIYVLNLGAVDSLGGTFEIDFYLYFTGDTYYSMDLGKVQGYFPNALKVGGRLRRRPGLSQS